jgi:UPF0716 protein FxsA
VFGKLFLLFTVLPLVDLYLLIQIGGRIGGPQAIALVLITGAVGAVLAKAEGLRVLRQFQRALASGRTPADGVVSGMLVLLGGALLITPGVVTDALGFALLVPFTRRAVARRIIARVQRAIAQGTLRVVHGHGAGMPFGRGVPPWARRGEVIDTEGEVVDTEGEVIDGEAESVPPSGDRHDARPRLDPGGASDREKP